MIAFALFILGGEIIHDFAFAIMLGIIIGTYSSIFVASPIVLALGGKKAFSKK
jgi:preprotein translocase subunit SecF